jgi:hypothetical protein
MVGGNRFPQVIADVPSERHHTGHLRVNLALSHAILLGLAYGHFGNPVSSSYSQL